MKDSIKYWLTGGIIILIMLGMIFFLFIKQNLNKDCMKETGINICNNYNLTYSAWSYYVLDGYKASCFKDIRDRNRVYEYYYLDNEINRCKK